MAWKCLNFNTLVAICELIGLFNICKYKIGYTWQKVWQVIVTVFGTHRAQQCYFWATCAKYAHKCLSISGEKISVYQCGTRRRFIKFFVTKYGTRRGQRVIYNFILIYSVDTVILYAMYAKKSANIVILHILRPIPITWKEGKEHVA